MLISVIIPTCNRLSTLELCLSALSPGAQQVSGDEYEVIVTDDGATTIAETLVRNQFPWVRWTAGPRRGPAANRNHGAMAAEGRWVAFTDDDCIPSPTWVATFAERANKSKTSSCVFEGKTTCQAGLHSILEHAPINLTGGNLWSCNMMLARQTFIQIGGFDERFPHANAEDVEFHARLKRAGLPIVFVPEAVVDHPPRRRHLGRKAGRLWEGRALLQALDPASMPEYMPRHVFKLRAKEMLSGRLSLALMYYIWCALLEFSVVLFSVRTWREKYAGVCSIDPSCEMPTHRSIE